MNYLEGQYQPYPHNHEHFPSSVAVYPNAPAMHNYAMAHHPAMMPMPPKNDTKPRLGKDEVEILEQEFQKNPKPTTQTKRGFAEEMGVDLARINNWFQNRRAKRKQEKKHENYEALQKQEALGYSEPSTPDVFNGNNYFGENIRPLKHSAAFPIMNGPPPAAASYNPQYSNPSTASLESLQRTIAAAQASQNNPQPEFDFLERSDSISTLGGSLIQDTSRSDRAQFPSVDDSMSHFEHSQSYSYPSTLTNPFGVSQPMTDFQHSPEQIVEQTPIQFSSHASPEDQTSTPQLMTTFPSPLLAPQSHAALAETSPEGSESQSPEDGMASSLEIGFRYDVQDSDESSDAPPPPSSLPFRSPPPPMDIASRRKKVQVKPAALTADTLRGRPQVGPRTVSHAEGFRRQSDSPISSPMRRIVSAGGNRNGMSGRIQKPTIDSAQRSPINFGGFADAGAFMEHNYQNIRNPPNMTASSSVSSSSLAPPTPLSPRREMTLGKSDGSRSTASPTDGDVNFMFDNGVAVYFPSEGEQNFPTSPPETPHNNTLNVNAANGWPSAIDFEDKQWAYEVPDEPQFTPANETFPLEIQMPQPQPPYLSVSQPVTPAFGQFNANFIFGHESPSYQSQSPSYTLSTQNHAEYRFPESYSLASMGMSTSPINKQKTFHFSNSTPADFSEK